MSDSRPVGGIDQGSGKYAVMDSWFGLPFQHKSIAAVLGRNLSLCMEAHVNRATQKADL